jgi:hypothetical protein
MSQLQVTGEAKIRDIQGPVVANDGVITALDGAASQYVRGDGTLADFPTSSGGGSSVSYYLNSSVSQGTIGGVAYRELSKEPIIGAGTDIAISANGYVASYLTDANDPDVLSIPGGNFNCEFYFSVNNNTGNPFFYAELYKYDGTTFTLLGSSVGVPEYINQGTIIAPYYFAIPVPTSALALTDRLAIRIYVNVAGRTVTLHTENGHLCQVVTTLSKGMVSLNNLTDQSQYLTTGTSGTNFSIVSSGDTHTFNLPVASATNTGKLSSTDWSTFNNKQPAGNYVTLDTIQTITAVKTFTTSNIFSGANLFTTFSQRFDQGVGILETANFGASLGYTNIVGAVNGLALRLSSDGKKIFAFADGTTNNTFTFPNASGTIALTSDISYPVTSVFGRTGAVVAQSGDYTTTQVTEGTNLYFTDARSRAAISLTTTGSSGAATYNSTTGVFNIPNYGSALSGYVTLGTTQTITGDKIFDGNNVYNGVNTYNTHQTRFTAGIAINQTLSGGAVSSHTVIGANVNGLNVNFPAGGYNSLNFASTSVSNTYTFPNATGTIALTSNLSAYLPLTGGTLTGVLNGTSATFSGNMAIGSSTTALSPLQVVATGTIVRLGEQSGTTGKQFLIGIDATSGRTEMQSVWQGTGFTSLALQPSGGNVLIGTTTDNGARLQVSGAATFSGNMVIGGTNSTWNLSTSNRLQIGNSVLGNIGTTGTVLGMNLTYDSAWKYISNGLASLYSQDSGDHVFFTSSSSTAGATATLNEKFRIANTGAATFTSTLSAAQSTFTSSVTPVIFKGTNAGTMYTEYFYNTSTLAGSIGNGSGMLSVASASDFIVRSENAFVVATNGNNERMRIRAGGNIGIGFTGNDGIRLVVRGQGDNSSTQAFNVGNSNGTDMFFIRNDGYLCSPTTYNNTTGSGANLSISASGFFERSTSSLKYKKDVRNYDKGIAEVMQMRPVYYKGKGENDGDKQFAGLIAEEIHELGLTEFVQYAEDGTPDALAYQNMIALAFKAIQELKAEIEILKNK